MTLAQAAFAFADSYAVALVARAFVGIGDAMTFICVLRLVSSWFPVRRIPLVTQLTGTLGQLGAVLAAIPMTWALGHLGWTPAYLGAAAIGVVLTVALLFLLGDAPGHRHLRGPRLSLSSVRQNLADSWAQPGTRLGFWMHFTSQFSATTMSLLWGYPFFVRGEGRSPATAGLLLTLIVVAIMASGPVLGWLVGTHPWHRSTMVLTIVGALVAVWTAVLVWPGDAPLLAARRCWWCSPASAARPRSSASTSAAPPTPPTGWGGHRDHQPGRLLRQPVPRRRDRAGPRLAYAGRRHRLPGLRLPLGDERAVPALGRSASSRSGATGSAPAP